MSGVRGNTQNLRNLNKKLRAMSEKVAEKVATRAAAALTTRVQAAYDSGVSVYGDPRPNGLTLYKEGKVRGAIGFTAIGTLVRAVLNQSYARFLIGKYGILPNGNAALPVEWNKILDDITKQEVAKSKEGLANAA